MADQDAKQVLDHIENKLMAGETLTDKEILDLIFSPIMGGNLTKENKIVRALKLSKDYPIDKQEDVQSMLYTFALKFLANDQLEEVKEVIKMTELGRMLREDGIKEGIKEGMEKKKIEIARKFLKSRALTKEEIAENLELSLEEIEEIEKELTLLKQLNITH